MAASSSSLIPPPQREYNVFLNFSGPDTRKSFISHLRDDLERNGFHTFRDDKNLERGQNIGPGILKAIANSSMSLVVFSNNYFASSWCLRELKKIMECKRNSQHFVLPIFYNIEPSEIRNLNESIAKTLAKTLAKHEDLPQMENWREILTEVANLSGIVCNQYRDEASLVKDIVKDVGGKLNSGIQLNDAKHPVGIEPRLDKLLEMLCLESSDDVRIVAIWGVGGLGKTTIAKAAYNYIRSRFVFEGCSFVKNVRETWKKSNEDLLALQKQILSDFSNNEDYKVRYSDQGVGILKRFYGRKVLLVLDDVDCVEQLDALAIDPRFFYRGSRIIVTTRDISSLNSLDSVLTKYELELLNEDESLRLFSLHAFNQHNPPEDFIEFSKTVGSYAGGIPLVLEVLGCYLNGKNDQSVWRSAITKLENIPHEDVQRKLRISYDSLNGEQQKLFLEIACFFVGESKYFTIQVLEGYEIYPEEGFQRLKDLCLLKCGQGFVIEMHDILKQMGREIVRQENVDYLGKRSRLWDYKDALKVLKNCEGTDAVEGLILLHKGKDIKVKAEAFQKMTRLRVLHLNHVLLSFDYKLLFRNSGYKDLFRNLVWLRWHHFDLNVLPSQLNLENLVSLDLSISNIKRVWEGTKVLNKLKFLYLDWCRNLTTTLNFSGLPNLEELSLSCCERLQEVDKSIGHLDKLQVLNVPSCKSLRKLLPEMGVKQDLRVLSNLTSLQFVHCYNLTTTPNFSWIPNLMELDLIFCLRLQEVDRSIEHLHKLRFLCVKDCNSLRKLPLEMVNLKSLKKVCFVYPSKCQTLTKKSKGSFEVSLNFLQGSSCLQSLRIQGCSFCSLTQGLSCLKSLHIQGCSSTQLPDDFGMMISLSHLKIENCSLTRLPDGIGSLISLFRLDIRHSKFSFLPKNICNLTRMTTLRISYCDMSSLPSELGRLKHLRNLNLEGNNFCSLPESIGDLTNLCVLRLRGCERLQSLPKLSGHSSLIVDVENCTSLRRISLESITDGREMYCYNCPKLDEEYCAHKIGTSFLDCKVVGSFEFHYSEGMFPDWLQHETTNSYYALKVPRVGNKHFIRCIFYVAYTNDIFSAAHPNYYGIWGKMKLKLHNKTKYVYIDCEYSSRKNDNNDIVRERISFYYRSFHVDKLDLKEGDEIEISWIPEKRVVVKKKWGVHVSYYTIDDHH